MRNKVLLLALFIAQISFAQSATESMAWIKIGHRIDLTEAWRLTSSGQYRTGTSNDHWLTEIQFTKSVNKKWDIGTELRHYLIFDTQGANKGTFQRARVQFRAERHLNLPRGKAHIRYALQQRAVLTGSGNHKFTGRIRGEYDLKIKNFSWDPTFGVEYFAAGTSDFDRSIRFAIGTGDKIAGRKISFGYFYQRDLTNTGMHSHVVQTALRF